MSTPLFAPPAPARLAEKVWALLALWLFLSWLESSDVSQQVIAEKKLEGCIAQFGPGASHRNPEYKCAPMVEAPNDVMIIPVRNHE